MKDLAGKTAVVTGGGSGIGRGCALAFAEAGMNVVVADIDEQSASVVAAEIEKLGTKAIGVQTDVADRAAVEALADAAWSAFGAAHLLHNNAGVSLFVRMEDLTDEDWAWTISINLFGVVNGIQAFLPRFKALDGETHIVNTASMAGIFAGPGLGSYHATKYAVVGISESLREEVAADNIGVSVVCPGLVMTNLINTTLQRRPAGGAEMTFSIEGTEGSLGTILTPEEVGQIVRRGVERNDLYIFTHPEWAPFAQMRFDGIMAAFDEQAKR